MTPGRAEKNELAASSVLGSLRRLPQRSLLFRAVILGGVVLVAASVILPLGRAISSNRAGLFAGAAAGGVCLLAAWLALGLSGPLRRPQQTLALVLVGMLVRMGIPLAAALAVCFSGGPLVDAGFLYYLVVFYPLTLTVETFLSLPESEPAEKIIPPARNFVG